MRRRRRRASDARHDSTTARRQALAGIATAFADGFDAACELDVVVTVATRDDPVTFAGWRACRHVTRRRPSASKRTAAITAPAPAAATAADPPPSTVEHEALDKAS